MEGEVNRDLAELQCIVDVAVCFRAVERRIVRRQEAQGEVIDHTRSLLPL